MFLGHKEGGYIALECGTIGCWSEIKLAILDKYARAYARILSTKGLKFAYIDGFAGPGMHISRQTGRLVPGSPLNALRVSPPFHECFLVDLDGDKADQLRELPEVASRTDIHIIAGDCNRVLIEDVFPKVRYEDYCRALCVLDPYGLHLDWQVVQAAGRMRSVELFINFPVMDMNRNALWRSPQDVSHRARERLTAFWGDCSWEQQAYLSQPTLFGDDVPLKQKNEVVVQAFVHRLRERAGFAYVADPLPMRNSSNAVVYYLLFAGQKPLAGRIVEDIMKPYRTR